MTNFKHTPVLLEQTIDALNVSTNKKYIDATIGGGGHAEAIIKKGGVVLGIDQDEDALAFVKKSQGERIKNKELLLSKGNFRDIASIAQKNGFDHVDGILFDLGVSSYQLDTWERGFSIKDDARLDMRMDKGSPLSAYEIVNQYPYEKLIEIFYKYGEEHNAREIALKIVETRKKQPITTTKELSSLIEKISHKSEDIHPATRIFQAIRIETNDELEALKKGLDESLDILNTSGRIVVISFHSLEDRIVKQAFGRYERQKKGKIITKKPITATFDENKKNRRARSAKLRVFEKTYV